MLDKIYGRLTVISATPVYVFSGKRNRKHWLCRCVCGAEKTILDSSLRRGKTRSCGCLQKEETRARNTGNTNGVTHGQTNSPAYRSWKAMKQRCDNPKRVEYKYYGGRGIRYCDSWRDFEVFYRDMGARPAGRSLDRVDTDGDYSPDNCRWATHLEQMRNRRRPDA